MEEKLAKLVEAMPHGVTIWKVDEASGEVRLVFANSHSQIESGINYEPLIGELIGDIFKGAVDSPYPSAISRVGLTGDQEVLREVPYGDSNHPHGFFNVSLVPLGDGYVGSVYENITIKRRLEQRLKQMAMEDPLTGLANHRGFKKHLREALGRAERSGKMVAVLFCDLDGFKAVNDTYGHETGDLCLKTVGEKLIKAVRKIDKVGRLGGDEFGIVLEGILREADIKSVATKLIEAITSQPLYLGHRRKAEIGISIGVAMAVFADEDIDLILQHADAAMYKAKQAGGNQTVFHNGSYTGH